MYRGANSTKGTTKSDAIVYSHLLVDGYIRETETIDLTEQIIPDAMYSLIWKFYHFAKLLFCVSTERTDATIPNSPYVYIAYSNDLRRSKCRNNKFSKSDDKESKSDDMSDCGDSLNCDEKEGDSHSQHKQDGPPVYAHSISPDIGSLFLSGNCSTNQCRYLPATLPDTFRFDATTVLFKCGGWSKGYNHALIFNTNSLSDSECVYNWKLPAFKGSIGEAYGNCVAFSVENQCVLSAGGQYANSDKLRALNLSEAEDQYHDQNELNDNGGDDGKGGDNELHEWEWTDLSRMEHHRYNPVGVVMEQSHCMMVVGGKDEKKENAPNLNSCSIYFMERDEWMDVTDCNIPRRAGGICCNPFEEEVFIGGGIDDNDNGNSVEWYCGGKDTWVELPNTNHPHRLHPAMWMEGQLLYIASILQDKANNSCEMIDLRICKQWSNVVEKDLLSEVFGITESPNTDNLYLVTN